MHGYTTPDMQPHARTCADISAWKYKEDIIISDTALNIMSDKIDVLLYGLGA